MYWIKRASVVAWPWGKAVDFIPIENGSNASKINPAPFIAPNKNGSTNFESIRGYVVRLNFVLRRFSYLCLQDNISAKSTTSRQLSGSHHALTLRINISSHTAIPQGFICRVGVRWIVPSDCSALQKATNSFVQQPKTLPGQQTSIVRSRNILRVKPLKSSTGNNR